MVQKGDPPESAPGNKGNFFKIFTRFSVIVSLMLLFEGNKTTNYGSTQDNNFDFWFLSEHLNFRLGYTPKITFLLVKSFSETVF